MELLAEQQYAADVDAQNKDHARKRELLLDKSAHEQELIALDAKRRGERRMNLFKQDAENKERSSAAASEMMMRVLGIQNH